MMQNILINRLLIMMMYIYEPGVTSNNHASFHYITLVKIIMSAENID